MRTSRVVKTAGTAMVFCYFVTMLASTHRICRLPSKHGAAGPPTKANHRSVKTGSLLLDADFLSTKQAFTHLQHWGGHRTMRCGTCILIASLLASASTAFAQATVPALPVDNLPAELSLTALPEGLDTNRPIPDDNPLHLTDNEQAALVAFLRAYRFRATYGREGERQEIGNAATTSRRVVVHSSIKQQLKWRGFDAMCERILVPRGQDPEPAASASFASAALVSVASVSPPSISASSASTASSILGPRAFL